MGFESRGINCMAGWLDQNDKESQEGHILPNITLKVVFVAIFMITVLVKAINK